MSLTTILLGAVLGAAFVLLARLAGEREDLVLALGLIVAAAVYLAFALLLGAGGAEIAVEVAGVVAFTAVARAGLRITPWWLALGWAAHVLWDVALHPPGAEPWVPAWYGPVCIGFDLLVAFYVALRIVRKEKGWRMDGASHLSRAGRRYTPGLRRGGLPPPGDRHPGNCGDR